jgi:hypothetical protein
MTVCSLASLYVEKGEAATAVQSYGAMEFVTWNPVNVQSAGMYCLCVHACSLNVLGLMLDF